MTKINRASSPVQKPVAFKETFVSFFKSSGTNVRAANQQEVEKPQVSIFKRAASAIQKSVSLGSAISVMPLVGESDKAQIALNDEIQKTLKKPTKEGVANVIQGVGDFVGTLSPSMETHGKILNGIGGLIGEKIAAKERQEEMEANLSVMKELNTFEKSIKNENVLMVTHAIKSHLGTKNAFHGAQSYVGYANSIISAASSATDASKLTGFAAGWASSLRSGLNSSIGMAITAGAALLPTALTSMEWFNAEQNKDEAHSINTALKIALDLENVVKNCRLGKEDSRINAAYDHPDLCSFLGQWVETAPPEPPALNRDYIDYFVEHYETIIDEMSKKLINLSPGEFGISFLQDLAQRPTISGHKEAQALCKLFKLDPNQKPAEFKAAASKAFQLSS